MIIIPLINFVCMFIMDSRHIFIILTCRCMILLIPILAEERVSCIVN